MKTTHEPTSDISAHPVALATADLTEPLQTERAITYQLSHVTFTGSISAAIFLNQLVALSDQSEEHDGWIEKTAVQWQAETGLNRSEQEKARKVLISQKLLQEKRCGTPAKLFYRLDRVLLEKICPVAIKTVEINKLESEALPLKDAIIEMPLPLPLPANKFAGCRNLSSDLANMHAKIDSGFVDVQTSLQNLDNSFENLRKLESRFTAQEKFLLNLHDADKKLNRLTNSHYKSLQLWMLVLSSVTMVILIFSGRILWRQL